MNLRHTAALALMSVVLSSSSVRADNGWWFLAPDRSSTAMQCQGARRMAFNPDTTSWWELPTGNGEEIRIVGRHYRDGSYLGRAASSTMFGFRFSVGTTRLSAEKSSTADTSIILTQNTCEMPGGVTACAGITDLD